MSDGIALTYGAVERTLMILHGVKTDTRRVTLRSRLQHLQRAHFPPGVRVGRGPKVVYGTDQFFQLVFALELAVARLAPNHAVRIVLANWPALRRFVDDGMARDAAGAMIGQRTSDRWCLLEMHGLDTLRPDVVDDVVETAEEVAADVVAGWMLGATPPPERPWLLLDLTTLVMRAMVASKSVTTRIGKD